MMATRKHFLNRYFGNIIFIFKDLKNFKNLKKKLKKDFEGIFQAIIAVILYAYVMVFLSYPIASETTSYIKFITDLIIIIKIGTYFNIYFILSILVIIVGSIGGYIIYILLTGIGNIIYDLFTLIKNKIKKVFK